MRKNFTFLFLLGIFGLFSTNLFAQQDATIDPENIRYWIGEGENQVVFIVNWAEPDTALAWGYRFANDSITLKDIMDGIAAADYRFSYDAIDSGSGYWLNDLLFKDDVLDLSLTQQMYASYVINGNPSWNTFDVQKVGDGDYVKWGDTYCGTMVDPVNWIFVWEEPVVAVYPLADEAMIDPSAIRYWIGEGEHEMVFAVNWANPDTCLAWGYRFNEETVTVKHVMDAISEADPRFSYTVGPWGVDNIKFDNGVLDLGLTEYSYFMYNVNGEYAWYGYDAQTVSDGDFVKFGDIASGTEIASWTYVWESEVASVYPYAEEAKIDFSEILYWVGEGTNEVVFAVNWNEPNRCLAWGYRFNEEAVTLKTVMDAIVAADNRFTYTTGAWGVEDIIFNVDAEELHYSLSGMWWLYNVNGASGWYGYEAEPLVNGDFVKFGDESCATEIAEYTYVWTQEVEPVWMNTGIDEIQNTMSVYPNPAVNETFVTLEDAGMTTISVYDVQGRMVSTMSVDAMFGEQVRISTEMLNNGVYFITVGNDNAVRTAKLVVK